MGEFENIPFENLAFQQVEKESGVCEVRYAPISWLTGTPELKAIASTSSIEDLGTFDGDVLFIQGKGWKLIETLTDTSEPKAEGVGPKGQRRIKSMFDYHIDGKLAGVLGTQRLVEGVPCVYLVKHRGGAQILIGDLCNPAYTVTSNFTAGKTQDDTVGCSFTVEANRKLGIYTGTITEV